MDEVMSSQFQELAKMNSNKRVHEFVKPQKIRFVAVQKRDSNERGY